MIPELADDVIGVRDVGSLRDIGEVNEDCSPATRCPR